MPEARVRITRTSRPKTLPPGGPFTHPAPLARRGETPSHKAPFTSRVHRHIPDGTPNPASPSALDDSVRPPTRQRHRPPPGPTHPWAPTPPPSLHPPKTCRPPRHPPRIIDKSIARTIAGSPRACPSVPASTRISRPRCRRNLRRSGVHAPGSMCPTPPPPRPEHATSDPRTTTDRGGRPISGGWISPRGVRRSNRPSPSP